MARFRGLGAFVVNGKRYRAGQAYADSAGAAQPGDVVWVITAANYSPMLACLDGGATTIRNASVHSTAYINATISGANSVDA